MRGYGVIVLFVLACYSALSLGQTYPTFACPAGWTYFAADDSCSAIWPREYDVGVAYDPVRANELSRPMNLAMAQRMCERHGASLPLIWDLGSQLSFYKNLMGVTSGRSFWLNVWSDPKLRTFDSTTGTNWITTDRRSSGFLFDWDTQRSMPRSYDRCVALHMKGSALLIHGGNEKMIGTDCGALHHVVCTKKRVPAGIGAVNGGDPRRMEFVWNTSRLVLTFHGSRIPAGTRLSFQTSDGVNNLVPYRQLTQCQGIRTISGASQPKVLNIVSTSTAFDPTFASKYCGAGSTTCDVANVTIERDWPFIRGAKYSLCFYVADVFSAPSTLLEYENNLLGEDMVLDVVQKYTSYQEDICEMRTNNIGSFYNGYTDRNAAARPMTPFDSAVEDSKDSLLSFETLNPAPGYDFLK